VKSNLARVAAAVGLGQQHVRPPEGRTTLRRIVDGRQRSNRAVCIERRLQAGRFGEILPALLARKSREGRDRVLKTALLTSIARPGLDRFRVRCKIKDETMCLQHRIKNVKELPQTM
jgi:hypothetical protein